MYSTGRTRSPKKGLAVLQTIDLTKRFDERRKVLDNVSVSFEKGHITAVMGPSGSGKTTLLYCLSGMFRPTSGQVLFGDLELSAMKPRKLDLLRRKTFGFIFQQYNLIDALNAIQNVRLPSLFGGQRISEGEAKEALDRVGLSGLENYRPGELSGGQCQRVAIARALAVRRQVVFADEPTGALDSAARREVLQYVTELPASGTTVVMVTHDPSVAVCASRVLFLYDGAIVDELVGADHRAISAKLADLESLS